jgi:hypothetical protein
MSAMGHRTVTQAKSSGLSMTAVFVATLILNAISY